MTRPDPTRCARSRLARCANVIVVTLSEWEEELRQLRADLGTRSTMLLRWHVRHEAHPRPLWVPREQSQPESMLVFALYPLSAAEGDSPVVEVELREREGWQGHGWRGDDPK